MVTHGQYVHLYMVMDPVFHPPKKSKKETKSTHQYIHTGCVAPPLPIGTALLLPHAWLLLLRLLMLRNVPPETIQAAAAHGMHALGPHAIEEANIWAALGTVRGCYFVTEMDER